MSKKYYSIEHKKLQNNIIEVETIVNDLYNNYNNKYNTTDLDDSIKSAKNKIKECIEYISTTIKSTTDFKTREDNNSYSNHHTIQISDNQFEHIKTDKLKEGYIYIEDLNITSIFDSLSIIFNYLETLVNKHSLEQCKQNVKKIYSLLETADFGIYIHLAYKQPISELHQFD